MDRSSRIRPYPWYYAVNDRPVKLVELPDGSVDCLVFDWACGGFVPDRSYFARVSDPGIGKDVDALSEVQFQRQIVELRRGIVARHLSTALSWERTGDAEFPYRTVVDGRVLRVRVNDFPAEPLYTLLVDGDELADLDDWPTAWCKPAA